MNTLFSINWFHADIVSNKNLSEEKKAMYLKAIDFAKKEIDFLEKEYQQKLDIMNNTFTKDMNRINSGIIKLINELRSNQDE